MLDEAEHCICLIHPMDPRGTKIGGIETYVRTLIQHAPLNWRVLLVGVDGKGDCKLCEVTQMDLKRTFNRFSADDLLPRRGNSRGSKSAR